MSAPLLLPNAVVCDLSHWNGSLTEADFETAVREGNLVGVVVKLIQGGAPDLRAASLLRAAYAAGVRCLGVYDFGTAEGDAEAFYHDAMAEFTTMGGVLVALDAERNPHSQMTVAGAGNFIRSIRAESGRYPTLYMGKAGPDGRGFSAANVGFAECILCDLWLPAYGPHEASLGSVVPLGFRLPDHDTDRGGVLRLWQFTDGTINGGPMPGLGKCDQSRVLFGSRDALAAWWGQ